MFFDLGLTLISHTVLNTYGIKVCYVFSFKKAIRYRIEYNLEKVLLQVPKK